MIPYGRQSISEADIESVVEVLRSDFLTQGPIVPAFECAVASYCGTRSGVATSSATAALHLACLALNVGAGDWVWTSPITFIASANCARYCGARVDFVDIDPLTYNMSADSLETKLVEAEQTGRLPKVVIPVHFAGQSCDMAAIHALGQRFGFSIIEDASHAIGGRYRGEPIGNGRFSDITVFSFHPVKLITTGEGGMAMTNREELAERMDLLRSHGVTRDPARMTHEPDGLWYYQQIDLGFNYRLTELQAALGLSQLQRLDDFVSRRNEIAKRYDRDFHDLPVTVPWQHPDSYSSFHLYVVRLQREQISNSHCDVFRMLREFGIGVNLHYIPVYRQPYYEKMGFEKTMFPESEKYYSDAISLPLFPELTNQQQQSVIEAIQATI